MSSETIWTRVRKRPWAPFRLKTSDGEHYDVLHPEMIAISKTSIFIAVYGKHARPGQDLPETGVWISPLHVTAIMDLHRNGATRAKQR